MKRILSILLLLTLLFILSSCEIINNSNKDIIILYTNDVHCNLDENIGYAGLSAYKKEMLDKTKNVVLVDCGDFSQGAYEGAVSKGENIITIMNECGYDYTIFGNHEFDYGLEQLKNNVINSNATFLNCNVKYTGNGENWIEKETLPYDIKTFGDTKIAFIGVTTPKTISESTPIRFMEDDEFVIDFSNSSGENEFYSTIQTNVDECIKQGADYVILLTHLGVNNEADSPYTSIELIQNTNGVDFVLDAHSHTEIPCMVVSNLDGNDVLLSSTGTGLNNIGKMVITNNNNVSLSYISNYNKKDSLIEQSIIDMRSTFEEQMKEVVGYSNVNLSCYDSNGIRMVRSRELPIGDFVADAYRMISGADIAMCNGGGIRSDLNSGNITYEDLISINPFGNTLCSVKVTGQEILDMLEYFYRNTQSVYQKDGKAYGEDGSFQQVSGIKFTINTNIFNEIEVDNADNFLGVTGTRRISNVEILENNKYVPLDVNKTYTLASHNYMIKNGGSGMLYFLANHELVVNESISDYQILIDYMNMLEGDLSIYENVDNRIIIN